MENKNEMLYDAVDRGDLAAVRELLDDGADPNWRNPDRLLWSGVHAASCTLIEIVNLMCAVWGHTEVVRLLLERGGDPNIRNNDGYTPLRFATNRPKVTALLLGRGADANARNNAGYTPLMSSALWGHTESVTLLLDHGANPWLADDGGRTALSECERDMGDYAGTRAALEHALTDGFWRDRSPPTLEELAAFQLGRMRSQIDEEEFVDTIPDALVKFYFSDWEGAAKWIGDWDREGVEGPSEWKRQRDEELEKKRRMRKEEEEEEEEEEL